MTYLPELLDGTGNSPLFASLSPWVDAPLRKTILLVDRRRLFRDCVQHMLGRYAPDIRFEGVATLDYPKRCGGVCDLVMLGIEQITQDNLEQFRRELGLLDSRQHRVPVLAVVDSYDDETAHQLVPLGLAGVISGQSTVEITLAALRFALVGGTFGPTQLLNKPMKYGDPGPWTPAVEALDITESSSARPGCIFTLRETDIIERIRRGLQNKVIAHELDISESTVKVHLRHIMKKLRATNRTQVAFLVRNTPPRNIFTMRDSDQVPRNCKGR